MDLLKTFDRAIKAMEKEAKGDPELMEEVNALKAQRPKLVEAILTKKTKKAMKIVEASFKVEKMLKEAKARPKEEAKVKPKEEAKVKPKEDEEQPEEDDLGDFSLESRQEERKKLKLDEEKVEKIEKNIEKEIEKEEKELGSDDLSSLTDEVSTIEKTLETLSKGKEPKLPDLDFTEEEASPEEKERLKKENRERLLEIEKELKRIADESSKIKKNWKELDDIKGDYSELAQQMKDVKKDVKKLVEEKKRINSRIKEIKEKMNQIHMKKEKKFGTAKESYKYFWNELLMVSVKLSEIEELFEKNEQVTDMDLMELETDIDSLERKVGAVNWVAKKKTKKKK